MESRLTWFFVTLGVALLLSPLAVWAVRFARRHRGAAVALTGLLVIFGMDITITPPPPPQFELVHRQAGDDEPKD
jgi:hypothetical protein